MIDLGGFYATLRTRKGVSSGTHLLSKSATHRAFDMNEQI